MGKRAMTDAAKEQKAEAILDCAAALFLSSDYEAVTMSMVARKMKISNGLLFVYFPTKQTLFFSLLMRAYHARVGAIEHLIQRSRPQTLDALFALIMEDLKQQLQNTLYIRLEAIRAAILEKNIDGKRFAAMKLALYRRMCEAAQAAVIPGVITAGEILDIFHIETALIEGFKMAGALPAPLRAELEHNGLTDFIHDFQADTLRTMQLYLQALRAEKSSQ